VRTFNAFAFVLLLSFAACTKAPLQEEAILEEAPQALYEMPVSNEASLKLLENPENEDENRTNAHLHILAEALLEATQKHDFSDLIYTFVQRDTAYNEIVLADMVKENSSFAQALEAELAILFAKEEMEKSADTYLNSLNFDYGSTPYEAGLYIPNAKTADFRRKPHTAVGSDVAVEDALELKHGDHIVALAHVEGAVQHYLVHEQSAKESPMPLLIVNVHTDEAFEEVEMQNLNFYLPLDDESLPVNSFRITQRYEANGRTDYANTARSLQAPNSWERDHETLHRQSDRNDIRSIHKNDIGKTFNPQQGTKMFLQHRTGQVDIGAFIVTYEWDFYASAKTVHNYHINHGLASGNSYLNGNNFVPLKCKMKRNHEFYQVFFAPANDGIQRIHHQKGHISWV